jgi:hypothetical protein
MTPSSNSNEITKELTTKFEGYLNFFLKTRRHEKFKAPKFGRSGV